MKTRNKNWRHVNSSAIRGLRYDSKMKRLDLVYANGEPYEYHDVPRSKFRALMEAESKGKFVNEKIKPRHPFRKLSG
jgi:lysyl-tRNA synthetase class 2